MLDEIRIRSLGVIDSSTLELGPGLSVITGETGAGKTMVVTALGLLLGGRADSGAVRVGAGSARVEGLLRVDAADGLAAAVENLGGEVEDDRVVVARNISAEGRSRAYVGGAAVPVAALHDVVDPWVAVHGQSDQHRLLRPAAQRQALDRFGGAAVAAPAATWRTAYDRLVAVESELAEVVASARERAREADQLRFGLAEIEQVDPRPGEDDELAAEESRLGHAETLRTAAEAAREALSSEHPDAGVGGPVDALGTLARARTQLDGVRAHDPEAGRLADRAAEVGYLLTDLAGDVASYASSLDVDPARLAAVSERRAAVVGLTRKYGEDLPAVLAWAEEGARRLAALDGTDDRIEELRTEAARLRAELAVVGAELGAARREAAARLGEVVTAELALLAMPHARLTVRVTTTPAPGEGPHALEVDGAWLRAGPHGLDDVEILLAANTGLEPRPLHKGASGGELSRVMLGLEVALAETSPVPVFVFDEVDAGVGGKAAIEVGRRLARLARNAQVLVVTHLPQVAAYADRHVVVRKASDGSITTSGLTVLADDARERELSRMMAGLDDSDTALAHARELLATAAPDRALA